VTEHAKWQRRPVRIIEVGPRDGLQNEPCVIPTEHKIAFVNALSRTGVTEIEAGAFVSPKAVPQLADSEEVFRKIERVPGVVYSALVPNERGLSGPHRGRSEDRRLHGRVGDFHST
jgi:Isopropylmalate/homocitrate/citramalate synthases